MASPVHSKKYLSIPVHSRDDLQAAIDRNQTDEALKIVQQGNVANTYLPNGFLPLNYSIRLNKLELVQGMLKTMKFDLAVKDDQGLTPVDHALITNNPEIISLILGHKIGATFDTSASQVLNPRQLMHINETVSEARKLRSGVLVTQLPPLPPLHTAAREGHLSQVQALINPKDPNAYDSNGITPLQHAVLAGKKEVVEWLISKGGAKTDILTQNGRSLVHLATIGGHPDLIPFLVETHRLNANLTDAKGRRPLHYAVGFEDLSTAQKLIAHGANPLFPSQIDPLVGADSVFSPLDMLLATAKERSRQRDPLELSSWDYLGSFALVIPWILDSQTDIEKATCSNLFDISSFVLGLSQFESEKSILAFLGSYLVTGFGYLSHYLEPYPILPPSSTNITRNGDTMPRWILGMNSGLKTITCYQVGKRALKGLAACWKNSPIETYRPLRNLLVHTLIGVNTVAATAASIRNNYDENLFLNAWDECMNKHRFSFRSHGDTITWINDFARHYKANGNTYNSGTFTPPAAGGSGRYGGSSGSGGSGRYGGSSGSGGSGRYGGSSGSGGSGRYGGSSGSGGSGRYGGSSGSGGSGRYGGSSGSRPPSPFSKVETLSQDPEKNRILNRALLTKTDCDMKFGPYCMVDGERTENQVEKSEVQTQAATVLGLSLKSEETERKKAYRNLQRKYHPDKCDGCTPEEANSLSAIVNAAYEVLTGSR